MKCPDCQDGYLVVKTPKNQSQCFLGCTNYKVNGQGCNKTISMREYYKMMEYPLSELEGTAHEKMASAQPRPGDNWEQDIMEITKNKKVDESGYPVYRTTIFWKLQELCCSVWFISVKRNFTVKPYSSEAYAVLRIREFFRTGWKNCRNTGIFLIWAEAMSGK